ncbi:MAG: ATPase [Gammaproteobacteria bacterium]|nr:ATPase [Gammaproteobacteria bacterium]
MTALVLGLGLDAGGTQTRWAVADSRGALLAEGAVAGITALQLNTNDGRQHIQQVCASMASAALQLGSIANVCAGVTGLDERDERLCRLISAALGIDAASVSVRSDIDIAYRDLFQPGEGYAVYAGTGSIAAYIDEANVFHRAGGRGVLLDDGGGGFWIAREALRHIWRMEDERPGTWRDSPMAVEMFKHIGGSDWSYSRQFFYGRERGDIGKLALAVAASANDDVVARNILCQAGSELARLGNAMINRFGVRPIALAGRAALLHSAIEETMRAALPAAAQLKVRVSEAHIAAARIAAKS